MFAGFRWDLDVMKTCSRCSPVFKAAGKEHHSTCAVSTLCILQAWWGQARLGEQAGAVTPTMHFLDSLTFPLLSHFAEGETEAQDEAWRG